MAGMRFEKGSEEWRMFTDFWALCQKYWIPDNTDEYWDSFIRESNDFCDKYKGVTDGIFPAKLAMAILDAKEEERKKL